MAGGFPAVLGADLYQQIGVGLVAVWMLAFIRFWLPNVGQIKQGYVIDFKGHNWVNLSLILKGNRWNPFDGDVTDSKGEYCRCSKWGLPLFFTCINRLNRYLTVI